MTRLLIIFLLALPLLGCGPGGRDTGKNKDVDRPKPADPANKD
jgi:hypothetical protein